MIQNTLFLQCYACNPNYGSERGLGFRYSLELSRHFEKTIIITENANVSDLKGMFASSADVIGIDVGEKYRSICWDKDDWRFYIGYRRWLKKAAEKILACAKPHDIVWQLSMIGFREPGYLWKHAGTSVIGPISGFRPFPLVGIKYLKFWNILFWYVKSIISLIQRFSPRVYRAYSTYSYVLGSTYYDCNVILSLYNEKVFRVPDTAVVRVCDPSIRIPKNGRKTTIFLYTGLLIERKGLEVAFQAFRLGNYSNYKILVIGDGECRKFLEAEFSDLPIEFFGKIPFSEVEKFYDDCDFFLLPSFYDATTSVLMEALAHGVPVLAFDVNGPGDLIKELGYPTAPLRGNLIKRFRTLIDYYMGIPDPERIKMRKDIASKALELTYAKNVSRILEEIH